MWRRRPPALSPRGSMPEQEQPADTAGSRPLLVQHFERSEKLSVWAYLMMVRFYISHSVVQNLIDGHRRCLTHHSRTKKTTKNKKNTSWNSPFKSIVPERSKIMASARAAAAHSIGTEGVAESEGKGDDAMLLCVHCPASVVGASWAPSETRPLSCLTI